MPKVPTNEHPADEGSERMRAEKDDASATNASSAPAGPAAAGGARGDTWIAQVIAGDNPTRAAQERVDGAGTGARNPAVGDDADALAATAGAHGRVEGRGAGRLDVDAGRLTAGAAQRDEETAAAPGAPGLFAALGEATKSADKGSARGEARVDASATTLAAGATGAGSEPIGVESAAATLTLSTPIDSPDFGAAFGVQVSLLAQDGVQQAELHLNPAETGPVSIHIALDGTDARIDFGADLAGTRAAIERSLPELAAALRDAGLTLTGGGVSQHAGERPSSHGEASRPAAVLDRSGAAGSAVAAARVVRRVAAGGVDLYA